MVFVTRHIAPLLMALLVLLQSMDKGLIWSGFQLNQPYIAENLCENRAMPEQHCEGQCHLHKALEKMKHKEAQQPKAEELIQWMICQTQSFGEHLLFTTYDIQTIHHYPVNDPAYLLWLSHRLDRPPVLPVFC